MTNVIIKLLLVLHIGNQKHFMQFFKSLRGNKNECLLLCSPALLGEEFNTGYMAAVQGVGQGRALVDVSEVAVHPQL